MPAKVKESKLLTRTFTDFIARLAIIGNERALEAPRQTSCKVMEVHMKGAAHSKLEETWELARSAG